jgi:hypothetical protein
LNQESNQIYTTIAPFHQTPPVDKANGSLPQKF